MAYRDLARDPRSNATLPTRMLAEVVQLDAEGDRLLERAVRGWRCRRGPSIACAGWPEPSRILSQDK
jgi:hypothetical protein